MNERFGRTVIVEITGEKERVFEVLNQIAAANPEHWRKVYRRRNSTSYRGRGCYTVDFQGNAPDEVKRGI